MVGAWGLLVSLLSWLGLKQIARIEALERDKADLADVQRQFDELLSRVVEHQDDDRDIHKTIVGKLDVTNDRLAQTNQALAKISGQLESR
jgi:cell division protein FtsB